MSDLDRFWGFVVEAGSMLRKAGKDSKPITDRVVELGYTLANVVGAAHGYPPLPQAKVVHLLDDLSGRRSAITKSARRKRKARG